MDKKVTVLDVSDKKILVGCDSSACEGCKAGMFCNRKNTSFEVDKPKEEEIKKGEEVIINLPTKKTIFVVMLTFALPLVLFVPGYYIFKSLFSSEFLSFIGGIVFLFLGFLISGVFFKIKRKNYEPHFKEKA